MFSRTNTRNWYLHTSTKTLSIYKHLRTKVSRSRASGYNKGHHRKHRSGWRMALNIHSRTGPAVIKGHQHFSYGGAILPESVTIEQYYDLTPSKKSNVRLNDELVPKPTSVNIGEKTIKLSIQREHPYQSHISRCAMFPTYRCPDDHETGVRAASHLPMNPLVPASASQVTVLSKTKGAPYRHELVTIPMETRRKAAMWKGQNGFQHPSKPVLDDPQVFYRTAPRTLCPNRTPRDWKSTLSERTANVLRNLEKAQWLTSYQLHYTGTGLANPLKMDDFNEKTIGMITGEMDPYTTQLGFKARILQDRPCLESTYPYPSPPLIPESTQPLKSLDYVPEKIPSPRSVQFIPHKSRLVTEQANKANESSQTCQMERHNLVFNSTTSVCEVLPASHGTEPQTSIDKPTETGNETEDSKLVAFLAQDNFVFPKKERRQSGFYRNHSYAVGKDSFELTQVAAGVEETDRRTSLEQPIKDSTNKVDKMSSCTVPCICSQSPSQFGSNLRGGTKTFGSKFFRSQSALREVQDSFKKADAHRRFRETSEDVSVDLRDNHRTHKKHSFYGLNSYFFRN